MSREARDLDHLHGAAWCLPFCTDRDAMQQSKTSKRLQHTGLFRQHQSDDWHYEAWWGRKKNTFASCFRPSLKKPAVPKIFIEHLKKKVFILVLNHGNRMKIGREMAEIRQKSHRIYQRIKIFNKKNYSPPVPSFLGLWNRKQKYFLLGLICKLFIYLWY